MPGPGRGRRLSSHRDDHVRHLPSNTWRVRRTGGTLWADQPWRNYATTCGQSWKLGQITATRLTIHLRVHQIRIPQQEWASGTPPLGASGLPVAQGIVRQFDSNAGTGVITGDRIQAQGFSFTLPPFLGRDIERSPRQRGVRAPLRSCKYMFTVGRLTMATPASAQSFNVRSTSASSWTARLQQ